MFNAALYAKRMMGAAYVSGGLGYTWQDASTDRIAGTDVLHAGFHPQALTARLEGGRRYAVQGFGVTPYAALQSTAFFMPSYSEVATSGPGTFALSYDFEDRDGDAGRTRCALGQRHRGFRWGVHAQGQDRLGA